jgi:hypothetical protein
MELAGKYLPDIYPNQALHQQLAKTASPALRNMLLNTQYPTSTEQYKKEIQKLLATLQSHPPESNEVTQAMIALGELQNKDM